MLTTPWRSICVYGKLGIRHESRLLVFAWGGWRNPDFCKEAGVAAGMSSGHLMMPAHGCVPRALSAGLSGTSRVAARSTRRLHSFGVTWTILGRNVFYQPLVFFVLV